MPLYEEKLISPLAVRFTQSHIRPVFQHGGDLEATIKEIKARPGIGCYDVILEAPFPAIEIIRWHQRDSSKTEPDTKHWFTLDNRRLYCLQRVAADLWPRCVGVAVEALYNATEGIQRKDDSHTVGRSVGIGHSPKALTGHWDWREAVSTAVDAEAEAAALKKLSAEDRKAAVAELEDAGSSPGTALERLCCCGPELLGSAGAGPGAAGSEDSTAEPTTPRSRGGGSDSSEAAAGVLQSSATAPAAPAAAQAAAKGLTELLAGVWHGDKGSTYEVQPSRTGSWVCWRKDELGSRRFTFWHDEENEVIWWGTNWALYMDASSLASNPQRAAWYGAEDAAMQRPRFTWSRPSSEEEQPEEEEEQQQQRPGERRSASSAAAATKPRRQRRPWGGQEAAASQGRGSRKWVPARASHE